MLRQEFELLRKHVPQTSALGQNQMVLHQKEQPVDRAGLLGCSTECARHHAECVVLLDLLLAMLLKVFERVEELRAVVAKVERFEITPRCHLLPINENGIVVDIEGVNTSECHLCQLKALNPDESFAASDREENAWLHLTLVGHLGDELESLDRVAMSWQTIRFNQSWLTEESTEVDFTGCLLQGDVIVVPNS